MGLGLIILNWNGVWAYYLKLEWGLGLLYICYVHEGSLFGSQTVEAPEAQTLHLVMCACIAAGFTSLGLFVVCC